MQSWAVGIIKQGKMNTRRWFYLQQPLHKTSASVYYCLLSNAYAASCTSLALSALKWHFVQLQGVWWSELLQPLYHDVQPQAGCQQQNPPQSHPHCCCSCLCCSEPWPSSQQLNFLSPKLVQVRHATGSVQVHNCCFCCPALWKSVTLSKTLLGYLEAAVPLPSGVSAFFSWGQIHFCHSTVRGCWSHVHHIDRWPVYKAQGGSSAVISAPSHLRYCLLQIEQSSVTDFHWPW